MRAGLILVPLDLRMSPDAVRAIVARAEPRHLLLGTGHDAPDPSPAGLADFPTTTVEALTALPADAPPSAPDGSAAASVGAETTADRMLADVATWARPEPEAMSGT